MHGKKILILSPHTDDAELGCGGSIVRLLEKGDNMLYWIVFSTAEDSLPPEMSPDTLRKEFTNVVEFLGINAENVEIYNYKVRRLMEYRQEILEILVAIKNRINPDVVIGPSLNDIHQDHIVIANEMVRAFKSSSTILSYELPWNHVSFNTQFFMKLTKAQMSKKVEILKLYNSQMIKNRNYFSPEFIFGLAKTRGIQVSGEYAESFEVIRWIE